jgi:transcriptional regulator with XRE-family HTH domain
MATFGERLKRIREQHGWSQVELAARAGVPYETIYRAERGTHQEPRISVAVKLARALGVSLDVLAGLYEDEETLWPPGMADACRLTMPADQMPQAMASAAV